MLLRVLIITIALFVSSCSSWVYRIDIPQGNYLEQKNIDKIQIGMTKEQVKFVLGSPVLVDTFDKDTWNYTYQFTSGRSKQLDVKKHFTIKFKNNKLITANGDFKLSENFNTPFNTPIKKADTKFNVNKNIQNIESE